VRSNKFKRLYQRKNQKMQAKVDDSIRLLVGSNDPRTLGSRKHGSLEGTYGHDLDFRNRILYKVDMTNRVIFFLRVCSHKETYGKF